MTKAVLEILSALIFLSAAVFLVLTFKKKISFFAGVFASAGAFIASFAVSVISVQVHTGENIIDTVIEQTFGGIKAAFSAMPDESLLMMYGHITAEQLPAFRSNMIEQVNALRDIYTMVLPSVLIITAIVLAFALFMFVKSVLWLFKKDVSGYPVFSELMLPKSAAFALAVFTLLASVTGDYAIYFVNIAIVIFAAVLVCGVSYLCYLIKLKVSSVWIRALVYIALFLIILPVGGYASYILIFLAVSDSFFNFRRIGIREEKDGQEEQK